MPEPSPLIQQFVDSFAILDGDMISENIPEPLRHSPATESKLPRWRPMRIPTPPEALSHIYQTIPGPFPPLFEQLLLNYRWLEVFLPCLTLRPNPPGPDLADFRNSVLEDKALTDYLIPRRLVPFAKGPDYNYDPVCFDLIQRQPSGDCPIIQLDHEDIFHDVQPVHSSVLAPSFEELIKALIDLAQAK